MPAPEVPAAPVLEDRKRAACNKLGDEMSIVEAQTGLMRVICEAVFAEGIPVSPRDPDPFFKGGAKGTREMGSGFDETTCTCLQYGEGMVRQCSLVQGDTPGFEGISILSNTRNPGTALFAKHDGTILQIVDLPATAGFAPDEVGVRYQNGVGTDVLTLVRQQCGDAVAQQARQTIASIDDAVVRLVAAAEETAARVKKAPSQP